MTNCPSGKRFVLLLVLRRGLTLVAQSVKLARTCLNCSMAVATSTPMFFQKDVKRSCTLREMHHYSREIGIKRSKSCADLPRLDALPSRQNPDCATSFVLAPPERGGTRGTRERMGISEQRIRAYGERRSPRAIASGGLAGRRHQRRRASTNSSGFGSASNLCSLVRGALVHGLPTHGDPRALTYHPRATAVEQSQQFAFETEFLVDFAGFGPPKGSVLGLILTVIVDFA